MPTFLEALEKHEIEVFSDEELNYFIQGMYILIRVAVRDNCDTFTINRTEVKRSKGGVVIGTTPLVYSTESVYSIMRESLLKIVERDALVQRHFQLEYADDDQLIYRISNVAEDAVTDCP
jgi:hypothetical protein